MILNSPTISGSLTVTGNIVASGSITLSGSVASASYADSAATASFAASASNAINALSSSYAIQAQSAVTAVIAQTASYADTFTVASTLTAQTLVVQTITSSVDFVTGSTRFGSISANTHQFTGSMSVSGSTIFNHNDAPTVRIQRNGGTDANTVIEFTNSSRSFYVGSNGTVMGLGGTSGAINSQPLQISSTGAATFSNTVTATEFILNNGSADGGQLVLASNGYSNWNLDNYNGRFRAYYGSTEYFTINAAGNVGIGVTTPNGLLSLKASLSDTPIVRFQNNITSGLDAAMSTFVSSTQTYLMIGTNYYVTSTGNGARFNTNYESSFIAFDEGTLRFGTGTTSSSPTTKLSISPTGLATFDQGVRAQNFGLVRASSFRGGLYTYDAITGAGTDYGMTIFAEGGTNNGNIYFCVNGSVTKAMTITTGGSVLVGQSTADLNANGWQLQASGGGHTSFAINNNEAFIFNNRNTGTTYEIDFRTNVIERGKISVTDSGVSYITTPSDLNLKKNFEDWNENVLNNFKNLNPQKFNFATEEDTQPKTKGFIAQELVESFPEAYPKSKDRYFFNPSGMVVYLMKAIQELKVQNDDLQSQINELKA